MKWWQKLVKPREKVFGGIGTVVEAHLPARRLGVLHAAGADRARGADRGRPGDVRRADRRALRDAVRGRVEVRLGRPRVPARALRRRGRARARARADDGVVRAPGRARRAEGDLRSSPTRSWTRRRRGSSRAGGGSSISAAGPISDFSIGAVFALCALLLPEGVVRDIFFNLAFAAYVGGFFNLNPFIERDGYHMLVDVPGRAGPAAAGEGAARAAAEGAGRVDGLARARALLAVGRRLARCSRRCFAIGDDAALQGHVPRAASEGGRLRRDGDALGRVLPAGGLRARQAAVAADAGA